MANITLAVIGGSGLYDIDGLTNVESVKVDTPFGVPSDEIVKGVFSHDDGKVNMLFLPRHGKGHKLLPSEINYRANIYALKSLGADLVLSVSAVGSMKEDYKPGDIVLPDQFFDRTTKRASTFFGGGIAGHVEFAQPVCGDFSLSVYGAVSALALERGVSAHKGGTYICIEGPQFSTKAESKIFRSWGVDVIGMTNMPEARLTREAELCYVTMAMVTDYDCWHETEETVTVEKILEVLRGNVDFARSVIKNIAKNITKYERTCSCKDALKYAIITDRKMIEDSTKKDLDLLIGKYL